MQKGQQQDANRLPPLDLQDTPLGALVLSALNGKKIRARIKSVGLGQAVFEVDAAELSGILQMVTVEHIERNRANIEHNGVMLLQAIGMLLKNGIAPPEWLANSFHLRWGRFERHEVSSLDECFGHKPDINRVRDSKAERRSLVLKVHTAVIEAVQRDPSKPIDGFLFEEIGQQLGFGKTKCREIYDTAVKDFRMQNAVELARVLRASRKP